MSRLMIDECAGASQRCIDFICRELTSHQELFRKGMTLNAVRLTSSMGGGQ